MTSRPRATSFWSGRLVVVILGVIVAEFGFVRKAWVIGSIGAAVAVAALSYASYTWLRDRARR